MALDDDGRSTYRLIEIATQTLGPKWKGVKGILHEVHTQIRNSRRMQLLSRLGPNLHLNDAGHAPPSGASLWTRLVRIIYQNMP